LVDSTNDSAIQPAPVVTSPGRDAALGRFPIIGVSHPDATFNGGVAVMGELGPDYELEWQLWGGVVELAVHPAPPDAFAATVASQAGPGAVIRSIQVRGFQGYQFTMPNASPDYTVMWYENGGLIRLRLGGLDDQAQQVIDAISTMTADQIAELTGGWIEATGA
jgi:hypothetical protein